MAQSVQRMHTHAPVRFRSYLSVDIWQYYLLHGIITHAVPIDGGRRCSVDDHVQHEDRLCGQSQSASNRHFGRTGSNNCWRNTPCDDKPDATSPA